MNVYTESNFLLELAFAQQEQPACQLLLQAAEKGAVQLYLPVYSLTEVFQTLGRRRTRRDEMQQYIREEIRQYSREVDTMAIDADALLSSLNDLLQARTTSQTARLFALAERLARVATVIPLTADILQAAPLLQAEHSLTPQDALVYASVRANLREDPSEVRLFVSRNEGDFKKASILADLRQMRCDYLSSFSTAVGRLRL